MKCRLVMEDWRQTGTAESIYSTPLGVELSMGDMHSGTTFAAVVELSSDVADEIETAWREHGAYPVLRLMPDAEHEPLAVASRAPCSCSALVKACERTIKYLREIGASTRGESTFPSADYADAMADDLEYVLKQNARNHDSSEASSESFIVGF